MRGRLLVIWALIGSGSLAFAAAMPLSTKEISLMLRSGYSNNAIIGELSTRHFADTFDSGTEQQLTKAGANAALLDALRTGSFQASPREIAAAQEKLATQEEVARSAQERAPAMRSDNHEQVDARAKQPTAVNQVNQVYRLLKGDLVSYHQGTITHFDDEQLEQKKYFLFFFSANWSPAGRKLTPGLVDYYNRVTAQHPEVETIFFSADRSQFGMQTYLSQSNMPWPAVDYPKIASKIEGMNINLIRDIPCLVLVNATGQILSQTGSGDEAKSPEQVLADLDTVLAGGQPKQQVARSR